MTDPLNTYSIRVKFLTDHRYPMQITAPTEEEALKLWIEEFLHVKHVREEK